MTRRQCAVLPKIVLTPARAHKYAHPKHLLQALDLSYSHGINYHSISQSIATSFQPTTSRSARPDPAQTPKLTIRTYPSQSSMATPHSIHVGPFHDPDCPLCNALKAAECQTRCQYCNGCKDCHKKMDTRKESGEAKEKKEEDTQQK